ncbi:MAG TPA: hypothetical protein ENN38_03075 [Actinobacteria bacterium]|nr:hypothetical protein [Actinomycetota bacterium]
MNPLEVQKKIIDNDLLIFTPLEFKRILNVPSKMAYNFLKYYTKKGLFIRLKNSVYCLAFRTPSEFHIANKLYQPSYISFEYALSYYHLIPETVYTITSATTKPTREFEALNKVYRYYKIKKAVFLGYEPKKIEDVTIFIAEPEKALVDYLYFVDLKKKILNERLVIKSLNKKKIIDYAEIFRRQSLMKLIKGLL